MITLWKTAEQEALTAITRAGVEVVTVDKTAFKKQTQSILPQILSTPSLKNLFQ